VVVAVAVFQLCIVGADARADHRGTPEVERRTVDRRKLACRNQRRVDRREAIRFQRQLMTEDVAGSCPGEVEVAVLREVDGVALSASRVAR
jgi:hypothetical protein